MHIRTAGRARAALNPSQAVSAEEQVQVVIRCCAIKPLCGWNLQETATVCRERCGGQGYLSCNRFGTLIGFAHAGMTAEGGQQVLFRALLFPRGSG